MTITVAMPYWGAPDYVRRAVRSVLAQTVADVRLVVIGDGEEPPLDGLGTSRLEVYTLPANRGTYFAHQLILSATPDPWYAPVDADDWVDPEHLEQLVAVGRDAVSTGSVWWHAGAGRTVYRGKPDRPASFHVGLFATERLRAIGGYNPAERLGQDTVLLRLLARNGGVHRHAPDVPTYHRVKRPGSLTTRPDTGHRSQARIAMKRRNRSLFSQLAQFSTTDDIRFYRGTIVPPAIRDELAIHVERLAARLGQAVAA